MLPQYNQWFDMYQRCTSERSKALRKAYETCILQDSWKSYDAWMVWATKQPNFMERDTDGSLYQIDKDLLGSGNEYNETSCCFLPKSLNQALQFSFNGFQVLPNGSYRVVVSCDGVRESVGCFKSLDEAVEAYLKAKKKVLVYLAEKWRYKLPDSIYQAILAYDFLDKAKKVVANKRDYKCSNA